MIPYIVFALLILIFRGVNKPKLIYLTLLVFNVFRFNTGWDYMSYVTEVETWGTIGSNPERYSFIWRWLFDISQKIDFPHLALAIPGFLTITVACYAISKIQKTKRAICDSLIVYALWPFFFLGSFSTVRQSLGIAIALLILYYVKNGRWVGAIILLVINYFIHPSSVVCVLFAVFFFPEFRLKMWHILLILLGLYVVMMSLEVIIPNSPFAVYEVYLTSSDSFGSKLVILLALLLVPTLLLKENKIGNAGITDVCVLALTMLIMSYLTLDNSAISRVADYFVILLVFVAPNYKLLFEDKKTGDMIVTLAFVGLFFFYLWLTRDAASQGLATSPFVPYQCILFH